MNYMYVDFNAKYIKDGNWNVLFRCVDVLIAMLIKNIDNEDINDGNKEEKYFPLYRNNMTEALRQAGIKLKIVDLKSVKLTVDNKYENCNRLYLFSNGTNCIVAWS